MHENTRLDIHVIIFVIPVRLKSDRHAIPSVWVDMSEAISDYADYTSGENVRFLLQVDVMLVGVVEAL